MQKMSFHFGSFKINKFNVKKNCASRLTWGLFMNFLKGIILTFSMLVISSTFASSTDCVRKITNDFAYTTTFTNIDLDQLELRDYGKDYLAQAIAVIRVYADSKGCDKKDINFGKGPNGGSYSRCRLVERYSPHSRSCYVETNIGYFMVTKNLGDHMHLVFNLWD